MDSVVSDDIVPRRFVLCRDEDVSGLSGVGHVAEGAVWWDGSCSMRWRTEIRSVVFYDSLEHLMKVHSHEGRTTIKFLDEASSFDQLL